MYVSQSVHCTTSLLILEYQWYLQFWISYLLSIFWTHSWEVCLLILNIFSFLVCLSVCPLPHFFTENRLAVITQVLDELFFSNFMETFLGCLYTNFRFFHIFLYICQSVHYLTSLLKIGYQCYLKFLMNYLSQIFWTHSWDF